MPIKPILFNTEMVRAILDGRKRVTRRLIKPQPKSPVVFHCGIFQETQPCANGLRVFTPPYERGDILYVRENWAFTSEIPGIAEEGHIYMADFSDRELAHLKDKHFRWRPSIHMPKDLARLFLRVSSVRAERLQNITADGCAMEGIWPLYSGPIGGRAEYYLDKFSYLWDSTVSPQEKITHGWDANPWVWVIEFEVYEKPEHLRCGKK